jgi:DNA-binding transcriptional regulator/RsmH inhibitor MraZ
MTYTTIFSTAVQEFLTALPILLYVERRVTWMEVKVNIIWQLVARKVVELVRTAANVDDLKRVLLLYLGELRLDGEGRVQEPEV